MSVKPPSRKFLTQDVNSIPKSSTTDKNQKIENTLEFATPTQSNLKHAGAKTERLNSSDFAKKFSEKAQSKDGKNINTLVTPEENKIVPTAINHNEKSNVGGGRYCGVSLHRPYDFSDNLMEEEEDISVLAADSNVGKNFNRLFDLHKGSMKPIFGPPDLVDRDVSLPPKESKEK